MHFYEDLLGNIVRIVVIDYHFAHVPINPLLVLPHEQVETIAGGFGVTDLQ
jgi:hypothetical protein